MLLNDKILIRKNNIAIRVDSSFVIGSGHVMRCITLAKALLKNVDADIIFFCRAYEGNIIDFIRSNGFCVVVMSAKEVPLQNDYQTWLGASQSVDIKHFIIAANQQGFDKIDLILTDHYGISEEWEEKARSFSRCVAVIDDLANRKHSCDFIIDQNYFKDYGNRYDSLTNIECKKLLGPDYTLLREEFADFKDKLIPFDERFSKKIITIFFGGTDPDNHSEKALKGLLAKLDDSYNINVILGKSNPNIDRLHKYEKQFVNVTIYIQVSNMSEHIGQSLLFVGAIGATTWERCICGTPGLVSSIAENQIQAAVDLHEIIAHHYLGKADTLSDEDYGNAALMLLSNKNLLKQQNITSKGLVSESGSSVVSKIICDFIIGMKNVKGKV
ncbi:UDP-2,4-diacetamido-2,4,6-trideoxy-beta-L-altropyranose hydrolase [Gammaproteobacteria bacterium AS21]